MTKLNHQDLINTVKSMLPHTYGGSNHVDAPREAVSRLKHAPRTLAGGWKSRRGRLFMDLDFLEACPVEAGAVFSNLVVLDARLDPMSGRVEYGALSSRFRELEPSELIPLYSVSIERPENPELPPTVQFAALSNETDALAEMLLAAQPILSPVRDPFPPSDEELRQRELGERVDAIRGILKVAQNAPAVRPYHTVRPYHPHNLAYGSSSGTTELSSSSVTTIDASV